jgi:hypothetical protein
MAWVNPAAPNLPDFTSFVQDSMGVPVSALPASSPWFGYAFNQAMALVIQVATVTAIEYVLAVYNCGGHILIRITPDQPGQSYFQTLRGPGAGGFNLSGFTSGIVSGSSDQGTSQTLVVPEGFKNLTFGDLDFVKTPWGRQYLSYAQDFGTIWGLS